MSSTADYGTLQGQSSAVAPDARGGAVAGAPAGAEAAKQEQLQQERRLSRGSFSEATFDLAKGASTKVGAVTGAVTGAMASTAGVAGQKARSLVDAVVGSEEGPKEPEWHANGTSVGLVIDVGSCCGYYIFLIITMFLGLEHNKSELLACTVGHGDVQLRSEFQAYVCEYTKAHLLVFPALTLALVLMYIGRDFLQKRLYYGLLRNGGVIDFGKNKPFADTLVILLIVNYLHVVWHLLLMYWLAVRDSGETILPRGVKPELWREADTFRERVVEPSEQVHVLGFLWGAVMIPGTLVIAFVFLGYDIEKTLLPLSQYVHGLEDGGRDIAGALASLQVFRDASVKMILEDDAGPVAYCSGSDLDTQYTAVVEAAAKVPDEVDTELPTVPLLDSLWPVLLLLRSNTPDVDARYFRWLWISLAAISISLLVFALLTLGPQMLKDAEKGFEHGHTQVYAQVPVMLVAIGVVILIVKAFVITFKAHAPMKRKSVQVAQGPSFEAFQKHQIEAVQQAVSEGDVESAKTK